MSSTLIAPADLVRWYTKDGGWKFGRVVSTGHKWARVTAPTAKRGEKSVLLDDLLPWPPARGAIAPAASRKVKRGAA